MTWRAISVRPQPPAPPETSLLKSTREQYVEIATTWQAIQMHVFMAQLEDTLYHDLIPVRPDRLRSPCHPTHDEPSFTELHATL
jgi:hypothetical protein